jgi:hypothetical protein
VAKLQIPIVHAALANEINEGKKKAKAKAESRKQKAKQSKANPSESEHTCKTRQAPLAF